MLSETDHFRAAGVTLGDLAAAGARIPRGFRLTGAPICDTGESMNENRKMLAEECRRQGLRIGGFGRIQADTLDFLFGDDMKTPMGRTPPNTPRSSLPKASAVSGGVLVKSGSGPGPTKPAARPTSRKR